MRKTKKAIAAADGDSDTAATDLKTQIRDHAAFFDLLIDLIPSRFYLPSTDSDAPWFKGLSKSAKFAAKKQTRENIKLSRRLRMDPNNTQSSTLEKLNQSLIEDKDSDDTDSDEKDTEEGEGKVSVNLNPSVTYEELRQRLHNRIEALKGNRGETSNTSLRKRNRANYEKGSGKESKFEKTEEKGVEEVVGKIEFGKVKLGEGGERDKKRKKLSKVKELERAEKLKEAMRDPEKGDEVAKKHSWKAAVSRAAGVKVHDDPKLLKMSMHKEKKRQEKNVGKWKERVESREKAKSEKQKKRAGNIAGRIKENKDRKIAKREKKLMRPGFEGRKEGYINK